MTRERRLMAEWLGSFSLLATVIGFGIMAERIADGNVAIALLGHTTPPVVILVVLITIFGPISGAHFNPAVTLSFALRGEIAKRDTLFYVIAQIIGCILVHFIYVLCRPSRNDRRRVFGDLRGHCPRRCRGLYRCATGRGRFGNLVLWLFIE